MTSGSDFPVSYEQRRIYHLAMLLHNLYCTNVNCAGTTSFIKDAKRILKQLDKE